MEKQIFPQGGKEAEQQKAMQDRARQQEDAKNSILSQIMDQNARARCKYKHKKFDWWMIQNNFAIRRRAIELLLRRVGDPFSI